MAKWHKSKSGKKLASTSTKQKGVENSREVYVQERMQANEEEVDISSDLDQETEINIQQN